MSFHEIMLIATSHIRDVVMGIFSFGDLFLLRFFKKGNFALTLDMEKYMVMMNGVHNSVQET
jgi:hypothetical protein